MAREERDPEQRQGGIWGTSYPGWLTLAALRDPQQALAAAVPFNPGPGHRFRNVQQPLDVLTWTSDALQAPLTIRGPVKARLFVETTGSDADWVVKLIDAYPDDDPEALAMSGYELIVSADIIRGRYRRSTTCSLRGTG